MIDFMDHVVHAFEAATDWNRDNGYPALTATSQALLAFDTPTALALHVSSLGTPNFATSYTLSTLGQIDGSIAYLYSTVPLDHMPSQAADIPLRCLVRGYRDIKLPTKLARHVPTETSQDGRKPTLLHARLALPPPSVLTGVYARRISPDTLLSLSLYSKSVGLPASTSAAPPPASLLAHVQHDTGRYSVEGLGSTDNALLGVRGLWNFGLSPHPTRTAADDSGPSTPKGTELVGDDFLSGGSTPLPLLDADALAMARHHDRLSSKPSLLSAGAEFYYSPFSHVIGLSTGLRFTTLAPHITPSDPRPPRPRSNNKPRAGTSSLLSSAGHGLLTPSNISHSSFPYTMTLTLTPLTGSISSTYSVRPTPNLALSSRFDFNFYSWESRYVVGGELWRPRSRDGPEEDSDSSLSWARNKTQNWFTPAERALKRERVQREEENVLKLRVDDSWNVKALWTGRVKSLLVSAGVGVSPVARSPGGGVPLSTAGGGGDVEPSVKRWTGTVGVSIAYST
jgi:distribution and morphology protein 10